MLAQILKHILKFIGANTKFSRHGEQASQGTGISSGCENQGAPNMLGSSAEPNRIIHQLLVLGNTWLECKGYYKFIINVKACISYATFTSTIIRPAEGQAMCMTNGISSVKVWPISSCGSAMGKIPNTSKGRQNQP